MAEVEAEPTGADRDRSGAERALVGGAYGGRSRGLQRLAERGGAETAQVVQRGLDWLRRHQDADGRWDAAGFMKHDHGAAAAAPGAGAAGHDVGATGLALLAFLADGSSPAGGPDREVVEKGVRWLRGQQADNGLIGTAARHDFIYGHAIATLALVEAYGLSGAASLRAPAQRAIDYLESHRNPYMVWRYQPRDNDNDTAVTGWCVMAYKSASDFRLNVNQQALKIAKAWFEQVTDPSTGRCGYTSRGEPSSRHAGAHAREFPPEEGEAMTAEGLMCRFLLGDDPQRTPVMGMSADLLAAKPPTWDEAAGKIDEYYWFWGTSAMYQMGKRHWKVWSDALRDALLKTQRADGDLAGSWDPKGVWCQDGGRIYSTALLTLSLQSYYRYTRLLVR